MKLVSHYTVIPYEIASFVQKRGGFCNLIGVSLKREGKIIDETPRGFTYSSLLELPSDGALNGVVFVVRIFVGRGNSPIG